MSQFQKVPPEVLAILSSLCDNTADQEDIARLEGLVGHDRNAIALILDYFQLHSDLYFELASRSVSTTLLRDIDTAPTNEDAGGDFSTLHTPRVTTLSPSLNVLSGAGEPESVQSTVLGSASGLSSHTSPGFFYSGFRGTVVFFSQELPFSLLIATVLTSFGLWLASLVYVSSPNKIAQDSNSSPVKLSHVEGCEVIGKITGMVDVCWADIDTSTESGNSVSLGRKYSLTSGLLEITYRTGAKVILQGPCIYKADSCDSGFLSIGKLTAIVEKKQLAVSGPQAEGAAGDPWSTASKADSEFRVQGSEVANHKSRIGNQKSLASNSQPLAPSSNPHPGLFVVHTPTATVTDLGTEFGVEVDKQGVTTSHVFRGAVSLQAIATDKNAIGIAQVLRENQSASVGAGHGKSNGEDPIKVFATPTKPLGFVREIPQYTMKTLDLVDVVAGGNGFSGKRNAGIDPSNGETANALPPPKKVHVKGDYRYHRVKAIPFVDGVFIPDGRNGQVQVDSAGHVYTDFPATDNWTASYIWTGASPILTDLDGIDYASPPHGALVMHANKGITFDLAAIRKANSGWKLTRFRSITGNTENGNQTGFPAYADVWVLVDGKAAFRRRAITRSHGVYNIAIPLDEKACFLTLVATDGGNGFDWDWIIFGDPRLELMSADLGSSKTR